jgi:hypothetical protein
MLARPLAQILAIASLSSPQFDANPFSVASGNVPDLPARTHVKDRAYRWRRRLGYENLLAFRIKAFPIDPPG